MSIKPLIILVPGAWHAPASFKPMTNLLETSGYTCKGIDLPTVGADPPTSGFEPDVEAIRSAISTAADAEQDIIVVMHSYGSVPATAACEGFDKTSRRKEGKRGGVASLVFISAFILPDNVSLIDALGGNPLPWFMISEDGMIVNPEDPGEVFYNDVSEPLRKENIDALVPFSYRAMFSKTTYSAYRDIPSTFVFCTKDNALPIQVQRSMVEGAKGVKWSEETVEAGHSPFLSMPDKVALAIRKAAGET